MNYLIKKHNVDIHAKVGSDEKHEFDQFSSSSTPKWLSKSAMVNDLSLRLTDDDYNDLVKKLNSLYPVQGMY